MKKVLYVVPGLNPLVKDGATNRVNSFIEVFSVHGYKVYVVPLCHGHSFWKVFRHRKQISGNCKWVPFPHLFYLGKPLKSLFVYIEKLFLCVSAIVLRCDFVLADYCVGAYIANWTKVSSNLIVNHRGDSIDEHKLLQKVGDVDGAVKALVTYTRKSVEWANYSICVSEKLRKKIEGYAGRTIPKCFIFPCVTDIKRFESVRPSTDESRIVLGYFGGLYKWQCIDAVIDIACRLRKFDQRYFLLILTNSNPELYNNQLQLLGEDNYMIKSLQRDEIPQWVAGMDCSFTLREDFSLNKVSSPTKLSESLAAGVPIVVTKFSGDYKEVLKNEFCGYVMDSPSPSDEELLGLHKFCLNIKRERETYFESCRDAVSRRTWGNYSKEFIDFLNS